MVASFGEIAVSDGGVYLVGMNGPRINVWRRLKAGVSGAKVVAVNPIGD